MTRPFLLAAWAGLAWNLYGVFQFATTALASREALMAGGMTPAQAELMAGLPGWMTLVFAIGVFGGLLGCALLLLRRPAAVPVLAASLAGYLALYAGDAALGVFAAFGAGQVAVLTLVVGVAAALLWLARRAFPAGAAAAAA